MKNNSQAEIEKLLMKKQVRNINNLHQEQLSFGEKLSDLIAIKAGSWSFIIIFIVLLCVWIIINSWVLINKPFDPTHLFY